jgi:tripartite-type tricarboxylate transporter receptor subunit TctC
VPGYAVSQWQGILAPAATPSEIVRLLNAHIAKAMHLPEVKKLLEADGAEPVGNKPEEFAAHIKAEVAHWGPIIKASGARAE